MEVIPSDEQIAHMTKDLTEARIANWLSNDLLTWQWWFILALLILPWIISYYMYMDGGQKKTAILMAIRHVSIYISLSHLI